MHRFWNEGYNDMMNFNSCDGVWLIFTGILVFLITIIVIILIVRLLTKTSSNQKMTSSNRATEILKERYALGEISEEEYKTRLNLLNTHK